MKYGGRKGKNVGQNHTYQQKNKRRDTRLSASYSKNKAITTSRSRKPH